MRARRGEGYRAAEGPWTSKRGNSTSCQRLPTQRFTTTTPRAHSERPSTVARGHIPEQLNWDRETGCMEPPVSSRVPSRNESERSTANHLDLGWDRATYGGTSPRAFESHLANHEAEARPAALASACSPPLATPSSWRLRQVAKPIVSSAMSRRQSRVIGSRKAALAERVQLGYEGLAPSGRDPARIVARATSPRTWPPRGLCAATTPRPRPAYSLSAIY